MGLFGVVILDLPCLLHMNSQKGWIMKCNNLKKKKYIIRIFNKLVSLLELVTSVYLSDYVLKVLPITQIYHCVSLWVPPYASKVDVSNLVTYVNWTPIFEWYVVCCGFKNVYKI